MPEIQPIEDLAVARELGADVLRAGELLVAPTDTVYGLYADAFSMEATERLRVARGMGRDAPPTVVVRSPRQLAGVVKHTSEQAERLIAAFWPGPLTLVLPANEGLAWDLGDTFGTVAVRMPAEEIVYELIAEIGPLACSAACPVGGVPPRTVEEAYEQLGDEPALYLDGGSRPGGSSTIVDCSRGGAEVLRAGDVSADDIVKVATGAVSWGQPTDEPADDSEIPEGPPIEDGEGDAGGPDPDAGQAAEGTAGEGAGDEARGRGSER